VEMLKLIKTVTEKSKTCQGLHFCFVQQGNPDDFPSLTG
jgi:hypothetical protein